MMGTAGMDPVVAARWLNTSLLAVNVLLIAYLIYRSTNGSLGAAAWGGLIVLSSVTMLSLHSSALSEPTFFGFALSALSLLAAYLTRPRRWLLVASAATVALACLTRNSGVALVPTGVIAVLLLSRTSLRAQLLDAFVFAAVSCAPMVLWAVRNMRVAGEPTGRDITFHPIGTTHFAEAASTVVEWFYPGGVPLSRALFGLMGAAAVALLIQGSLRCARGFTGRLEPETTRSGSRPRNSGRTESPLPRLLVLFVLIYLVFMVVSLSLFDANIELGSRHLSPVFIAAIILISTSAQRLLSLSSPLASQRWRIAKRLTIVAAGLALSVLAVLGGARWILWSHQSGLGFSSKEWRESDTVVRVKHLPSGLPIFSNEVPAIYFLTGKPARPIPHKVDAMTRRKRTTYSQDLGRMRDELRAKQGVVVYFRRTGNWRTTVDERWWIPTETELQEALDLRRIFEAEDGAIFMTKMTRP
jgi:hypothetical protein